MTVAAAAVVVAAVSAAATVYSTQQSNKAQRRSADAQKEASAVAAAQQKQQEMDARRKQVREQRIRAAQIEQGAQNQGVAQSSGELGSLSALSTNAAASLSGLSGQALAAKGINTQNQNALNAQSSAANWNAIGSISSSVGSLVAPYAGQGISNMFSSSTGVGNQVDNMINSNPSIF